MINHITDTKTKDLEGVYLEDSDELVSSKKEVWLILSFKYKYYGKQENAQAEHDRIVELYS